MATVEEPSPIETLRAQSEKIDAAGEALAEKIIRGEPYDEFAWLSYCQFRNLNERGVTLFLSRVRQKVSYREAVLTNDNWGRLSDEETQIEEEIPKLREKLEAAIAKWSSEISEKEKRQSQIVNQLERHDTAIRRLWEHAPPHLSMKFNKIMADLNMSPECDELRALNVEIDWVTNVLENLASLPYDDPRVVEHCRSVRPELVHARSLGGDDNGSANGFDHLLRRDTSYGIRQPKGSTYSVPSWNQYVAELRVRLPKLKARHQELTELVEMKREDINEQFLLEMGVER